MMNRHYPQGQNPPERRDANYWYVWCETGATEVLKLREYVGSPSYVVNFANGAYAWINPGDPLWEELAEAHKTHDVKVFRLTMQGGLVDWDGSPDALAQFDCIRIKPRVNVSEELAKIRAAFGSGADGIDHYHNVVN